MHICELGCIKTISGYMDDVFTETLIIDRSPGFRPKFVHQLPSSGSSGRLQTTCVGGLVVLHGDVSAGVRVPGAPSRSSCPRRSTYRIRRGLLVARGTSGDRSFVFKDIFEHRRKSAPESILHRKRLF